MDIIDQAHDKLFKETFGNVEIAKDFMNEYLPSNLREIINLETLEPQKDSFINKELKEVFSDLLFRVDVNGNEGYIYFLFEHKSYKDKLVIFQLLRYMIEIWESKIKKENNNKLPIIIPLLIYHDKGQWNIKTKLSEMILGYDELPEDIKRYIPNYEYLLYDLTKYKNEDIKLQSITKIIIKIMRDARYADKDKIIDILIEGFKLLDEVIEKDNISHYIESCLRYILNVRSDINKDEMIKVASQISIEGSELVMTIAEQLRQEGREEGRQEGIEKGIEKGKEEDAINFLKLGVSDEMVAKGTGLSIEKIIELKKKIVN